MYLERPQAFADAVTDFLTDGEVSAMKFVFFHLMPYPYLPDDFDERYASPSLTFPNRYFDRNRGVELYHRYLDELEYAEKLGFDGIAVNEHHQTAYGLMPSPNIMAAALARRTSTAKVMVLGNAIGIRDHPLRVAEEIAMLDHLTDGRIVSGFVRGIGSKSTPISLNPRSRERASRGARPDHQGVDEPGPFAWAAPTTSSATSTCGRGRCRSRIRRSTSRARAAPRR